MKCPNCGVEIAEGCLYCEHCGEDIRIVPDFEPEIEWNIEKNITDVMQEIGEEIKQEVLAAAKVPKKRGKYIIMTVIAVALVLVGVMAGLRVRSTYNFNSEEFQAKSAQKYVAEEDYDSAITCYGRALELNPGELEYLFSLAEVYFLKNDKIEYERLLKEIIGRKNITFEQLERAFGKLIAIYRAKEDYQTINTLLLQSENSALMSTYWNYVAMAPEFSVPAGYYTSAQPLKLSATGTGKIYYTLDGSTPTTESNQYIAPLILENGDYIVTAFFVNEKGAYSDVVSKEYHIENDKIYEPEISLMSGDYFFPINIEVTEDTENVYYTTDGSNPTVMSTLYTEPIPMPLGKSTFKFARIVDGVVGTVAERNYNLEMNTDLTPAQAVEIVVKYVLSTGKIYDMSGFFDGSGDSYVFLYQHVTNINGVDDFYVVAEGYKTAQGVVTRTGNNYAVNAYTGKLFKLQQDKGIINLLELEIKTDSFKEE